MSNYNTGAVKWFNVEKGYGFIDCDDGSGDIFVHASTVDKSGIGELKDGQKLQFDININPKNGKRSATNLIRV